MDDLFPLDAYLCSLRDTVEMKRTLAVVRDWSEEWIEKIENKDVDFFDFIESKFLIGRSEHDDDLSTIRCKHEGGQEFGDLFHYAHIYRWQTGSLNLSKFEE